MTIFTTFAADFGVKIRAVPSLIGSSSLLRASFSACHNYLLYITLLLRKAISLTEIALSDISYLVYLS
jgi:hypothetical protein